MDVGIFGLDPDIATEQLRSLLEVELDWLETRSKKKPCSSVSFFEGPPSWSTKKADVGFIFRNTGAMKTREIVEFLVDSMAAYMAYRKITARLPSWDWERVH